MTDPFVEYVQNPDRRRRFPEPSPGDDTSTRVMANQRVAFERRLKTFGVQMETMLAVRPYYPSLTKITEREKKSALPYLLEELGRVWLKRVGGARQTMLTPAAVPWVENGLEVLVESGGTEEDGASGGPYSPANEVVEGTVVIVDRAARRDLIRGDANVDGGIDISDAVLMLNSLFTASRPLTCEDAADADDNGALNITDPILLLGVLFGGQGVLPAPSSCGPDPTADALGCEESCSAG